MIHPVGETQHELTELTNQSLSQSSDVTMSDGGQGGGQWTCINPAWWIARVQCRYMLKLSSQLWSKISLLTHSHFYPPQPCHANTERGKRGMATCGEMKGLHRQSLDLGT